VPTTISAPEASAIICSCMPFPPYRAVITKSYWFLYFRLLISYLTWMASYLYRWKFTWWGGWSEILDGGDVWISGGVSFGLW
jgi:hypothetical protein